MGSRVSERTMTKLDLLMAMTIVVIGVLCQSRCGKDENDLAQRIVGDGNGGREG